MISTSGTGYVQDESGVPCQKRLLETRQKDSVANFMRFPPAKDNLSSKKKKFPCTEINMHTFIN